MAQAWYSYPTPPNNQYGFYPDPMGNYKKPDYNVCVPSGIPITALLAGTVSNISPHAAWGQSVTIKLDSPLNAIATHSAYNFLGSVAVSKGQHVNSGDTVGYAGSNKSACTAFGLTADSVWGGSTFLTYNGDPRLDPTSLFGGKGANDAMSGSSSGTFMQIMKILAGAILLFIAVTMLVTQSGQEVNQSLTAALGKVGIK